MPKSKVPIRRTTKITLHVDTADQKTILFLRSLLGDLVECLRSDQGLSVFYEQTKEARPEEFRMDEEERHA